jgi:hypothetical protein
MFKMKGYTPELINTYECTDCINEGSEHKVEYLPHPDAYETIRKCTGCGAEDGPWIKADY